MGKTALNDLDLARDMARRIEDGWEQLGWKVHARIEERASYCRSRRRAIIEYDIRSDMVGGLPVGYAGPLRSLRSRD